MAQGVRFEPTTVADDRLVARARLTQLLNGRFTHRLTTVVGAAGFGKTTAVALAVDNNRLDPIGTDVWLTIASSMSSADALYNGIAHALDVEAGQSVDTTLEHITDALWSAAPDDVVLIIDDAHFLVDDALDALSALVVAMPANAHLLVGSRTKPQMPMARLRAHGQLLEVGETDLALDDAELTALARRNDDGSDTHLPRHVATADLQLAAGIEASADFMWEEVLAGLDPDRLTILRRCSVLDDLDDDMVACLSDNAFDTDSLLDKLPLVERFDDGCRLHPILREALSTRLEPGERRKTLSIAADAELQRQRVTAAVRLYHEAGDSISALEAAREFAIAPTMVQTMADVTTTRRIVDQIDPDAPVRQLLDALTHFAGLEAHLGQLLTGAASAARAGGDDRLEAVALYRAGQTQLLHHSLDFWPTFDRLAELAEHDEFARGVHAYFRTILDQLDGRPDDAVAALDDVAVLGRSTELSVRAERLYDLGRPEQVAVGLTKEDVAILPPGAAAFIGVSIWARGDSNPESSLVAVAGSIERTLRARYTHPIVSTLATGALIALAAGETELARRYTDHGDEVAASGVGPAIGEVMLIARAAVTAVRDGDEAAVALLQEKGPLFEYYVGDDRKWPSRAQLSSLPLVYLARPDLREMLDRISVGPAITAAIAAGRALLQLRATGDTAGAVALPWRQVNLLRSHVLPPHLVELVCAAVAGGQDEVAELLDVIPQSTEHLERVARGSTVAAEIARSILGSAPRLEPFRLHACTLGPVVLQRNGNDVDAPAFTRRPKVRELFALLIERGRMPRVEIMGMLWPDSDDEKAQSSLRTTLSTLNDVLDPERGRGETAFHVDADAESIGLDPHITTDRTTFEELISAAQSDDNAGLPARALDEYRAALELYRGDYLLGVDASWIVLTRLRLRTLAVNATCRVAELVAAKGEPEEAARWAARGRAIDPLNDRAGRLFIAALDAAGDRSAARAAADELIATLGDADLEASTATLRTIDRLR
ncbi:MAG: BTAD domain-containing putative transcriptional regulator [Ilumatobacter sp.]